MPKFIKQGIIPKETLAFFNSKKRVGSFDYRDVWLYEHAVAFTVAKMMDDDLLADTQAALSDAIENGTDFNAFKKRLKPYLMAKGWWGEQVMGDPQTGEIKRVKLGSTRRLKTIFNVNKRTANAAGQWQRIQRNKANFPFLKYLASTTTPENQRFKHRQWYGLVLPVDDPFWQTHYPPNGYNCRCGVRSLTQGQAERLGISNSPDIEYEEYTNQRTGEVTQKPKHVQASFAHNHGDRLNAITQLYAERMAHRQQTNHTGALKKIHAQISEYINGLVLRPNFTEGEIPALWVNPIKRDKHTQGTKAFNDAQQAQPTAPSYFADGINQQALIYLFAGTGTPWKLNAKPLGQPGTRELIELKEDIGYNVGINGVEPVRQFVIVYAADGAHAFPVSDSHAHRNYETH